MLASKVHLPFIVSGGTLCSFSPNFVTSVASSSKEFLIGSTGVAFVFSFQFCVCHQWFNVILLILQGALQNIQFQHVCVAYSLYTVHTFICFEGGDLLK